MIFIFLSRLQLSFSCCWFSPDSTSAKLCSWVTSLCFQEFHLEYDKLEERPHVPSTFNYNPAQQAFWLAPPPSCLAVIGPPELSITHAPPPVRFSLHHTEKTTTSFFSLHFIYFCFVCSALSKCPPDRVILLQTASEELIIFSKEAFNIK